MMGFGFYVKFCKYLNKHNPEKIIPTSELGLLPNAPPEAVKAYEEYRKLWQEIVDSGSNEESPKCVQDRD